MSILEKIVFIHPTKCAGTTISKRLLKLKGFSENDSNYYSGHYFNRLFQKNITLFYYVLHSKNILFSPIYIAFYFVCFFFKIRNIFAKHQYGLTFLNGSMQHFTYNQWKQKNRIKKDSVCIGVVTHPQHRLASVFYFLGYNNYYSFIEFLRKIENGSILSEVPFLSFRGIIKQHIISMYDYIYDKNGENHIHFILKKESLNNDWKNFCKQNKLDYQPLEHINKTKAKNNWQSLYKNNPLAAKLVYNLYQKDFEFFGYKKLHF